MPIALYPNHISHDDAKRSFAIADAFGANLSHEASIHFAACFTCDDGKQSGFLPSNISDLQKLRDTAVWGVAELMISLELVDSKLAQKRLALAYLISRQEGMLPNADKWTDVLEKLLGDSDDGVQLVAAKALQSLLIASVSSDYIGVSLLMSSNETNLFQRILSLAKRMLDIEAGQEDEIVLSVLKSIATLAGDNANVLSSAERSDLFTLVAESIRSAPHGAKIPAIRIVGDMCAMAKPTGSSLSAVYDLLIWASRHTSWAMRCSAARSWGVLGNELAKAWLATLSQDPDKDVQVAANKVLSSMQPTS